MELNFGRLGFGFLRLPQSQSGEVELETVKAMVDLFLERGFRYFDTAYTYLGGKSEELLRRALVERHSRERYCIATKLPVGYLRSEMSAGEIFENQRKACGVDFFDVYLLHGLDGEDAAYAEEAGCFTFLEELKRKGLARCTGFSFYDTAPVLDDLSVSSMVLIGSTGGIITPAVVGMVAERAGIQTGMGVVVAVTVMLLGAIILSVRGSTAD